MNEFVPLPQSAALRNCRTIQSLTPTLYESSAILVIFKLLRLEF